MLLGPSDSSYRNIQTLATISNKALLRIAPRFGEEYTGRLKSVAYQDAVCLVLSLRRPLTGHYWLSINDRSVPFLTVVEQTNLVAPERYGGRHVVYIPNDVTRGSSLGQMTEGELAASYMPHLRRMNPQFDESWVEDFYRHHAVHRRLQRLVDGPHSAGSDFPEDLEFSPQDVFTDKRIGNGHDRLT